MHKVLWTVAWCCAGAAGAQTAAPADAPFAAAACVSDSRLAAMRGGFDAGNGLLLSLGVERLISINGDVVANNGFHIDNVTKLTQSQAQSLGDAATALTVVQNGPGNVAQPGAMAATVGGLFLQNSANDQLIHSQTTINAAVNSGSLLKALNFGGSMRDALSYAVGNR